MDKSISSAVVLAIVLSLCSAAPDGGRAGEPQLTEVIQQALAVASRIQPDTQRERALEITSIVQAKAGNVSEAVVMLDGIRSQERKSEALASLAHASAQHGHGHSAWQIAESIPDATLQAEALADIAEAQNREGDRPGLSETIQRALLHAAGIPKEDSRGLALAAIGVIQAKTGDLEGGRRTAMEIKSDSTRAGLLADIAEVQAQAGDWTGAQRTVATVQNQQWKDSLLATRVVPALAERRDVPAAADAAERITSGFYKAVALVRVAELQARTGDQHAAEQTFERVRQIAASLAKERDRDFELMGIAPAQASAGDVLGSNMTIAHMKRESLQLRAFGFIAGALATSGNAAGAREVAASIPEGPLRDSARWFVSVAQAEAGDLPSAHEIAATIRDENLRGRALVDIALAQGKAKEFGKAHETVLVIPLEGIRVSALIGVARAQTQTGDGAGAIMWASSLSRPLERWAVLIGVSTGLLPPSARCSTREARTVAWVCD